MPPKVKKVRKRTTKKKTVARKKSTGILSRVESIPDVPEFINVNIYGKSGTGKTRLVSTFPGRILNIMCSAITNNGEMISVEEHNRDKIDVFQVEKAQEVLDIVQELRQDNPYTTVALDHGSGLQDFVLRDILNLDELPAQLGWGDAKQSDWNECTSQTKEIFRGLLSLNCNTVIVAQERVFEPKEGVGDDEDEDYGLKLSPTVGSALTPSLTGWLNPACDYVCQTFIKRKTETVERSVGGKTKTKEVVVKGEVDYCLRTLADPVFTVKFRSSSNKPNPPFIINPTYEGVMELIGGS